MYYNYGLNPSFESFLKFILVIDVTVFAGTSMGILVGCVFSDFSAANAISGAALNIPVLFNGFYTNLTTFPLYIKWMTYISIFRYSVEALAYNEFEANENNIPFGWNVFLGYNLGFWKCLLYLVIMSLVL